MSDHEGSSEQDVICVGCLNHRIRLRVYFYVQGERMNECYSSSIGIMESLEACPPKCSGKFLAHTIRSRSSLPEAKATLALVDSDRKGLTMVHSVKKTLGAFQKIAVVTRSG